MGKRLTTEIFTERSTKKHNGKYDYSKSVYISCFEKVLIICSVHGEFLQKPADHLSGNGCQKCSNLKLEIKKD